MSQTLPCPGSLVLVLLGGVRERGVTLHPGDGHRPAALVLSLLLGLFTILSPLAAHAQPQVSSRASPTEVEVGEPFLVEVKALVERGSAMPSDPDLRVPGEMTIVSGPSVSTQMKTQIINGTASTQLGIGATWQVVATKPGRYTIPAPTISWNGQRLLASPLSIKVVPASGRPRRPQSPFMTPGGPLQGFPWPFGGVDDLLNDDGFDEPEPDENPALSLPKAPSPVVFLRAIPDKTSAVVGEQVTVSFYLYFRESAELAEPRAAPAADFVRYSLLDDPRSEKAVFTRVGGERYGARLIDRLALFPLKAGELHVGSMQARITGRRIGSRVLRESNDVVVRVLEPPLANRPAGYGLGDVGRFTLTAAVQPREVDQGGSVAVSVKVTGTGNFPQSLRLPERRGIEWLGPEKRESIEPRGGKIGGFRSFGYVARVEESGTVDLGSVELAHWDPEEKRYVVESTPLGKIEVRPVAPPIASSAPAAPVTRSDPFAAMPSLRPSLSAYERPAPLPIDGAPFWLLLAAPPLAVTLYGTSERFVRRLRERRASSTSSPARLASVATREAEEAAARGNLTETAAAVERAVHRGIEAATGLRSRGVLLDTLPAELEQRGVPRPLAERVSEVLSACEAIRFEPDDAPSSDSQAKAGADPTASAATDLLKRARAAMAELSSWKPA